MKKQYMKPSVEVAEIQIQTNVLQASINAVQSNLGAGQDLNYDPDDTSGDIEEAF